SNSSGIEFFIRGLIKKSLRRRMKTVPNKAYKSSVIFLNIIFELVYFPSFCEYLDSACVLLLRYVIPVFFREPRFCEFQNALLFIIIKKLFDFSEVSLFDYLNRKELIVQTF